MRALVLLFWLAMSTSACAEFRAVYVPPKTSDVAKVAEQLQADKTLDKLAARLNRYVSVSMEVPLVAQSCGQVNAFYMPEARAVVICYELLAEHAVRIAGC